MMDFLMTLPRNESFYGIPDDSEVERPLSVLREVGKVDEPDGLHGHDGPLQIPDFLHELLLPK